MEEMTIEKDTIENIKKKISKDANITDSDVEDYYKECGVECQMGIHFTESFEDEDGKNRDPWQLFLRYEDKPSLKNENELIRCYELSLYIHTEIYEPNHYITLFQLLRRYLALPHTTLTINIDSCGGDLFTLTNLVSIIDEANIDCRIITNVNGQACSAAFILACMGDEINIGEYAMLMAHNLYTTSNSREMTSVNKSNIAVQNLYKRMLNNYGKKFLTDEEITNITENGAEIWLNSDEANERYMAWINRE